MKKEFVAFYSPGSFVSETTEHEIESWGVGVATKMADEICERHGATPYGFVFFTRERGDDELNSKRTESSPFYFLGGKVETLQEVKDRKDPADECLIGNMECNDWGRVVTNTNSWKTTLPLEDDDVVLDYIVPKRRTV